MPLSEAGSPLSSLMRPRALLLALTLLALLVLGLGRAPLFDVDEGAFSEATREMLASGDWGHTTLNGADRFDKPIGVYWLQAASVAVFGINEWAVRLPSALAAWVAALALGAFAAARLGPAAGALAAVVHATAFGSWAMAHAATADAVLGLWLVLSALDLWRYLERGDLAALRRLGAWVGLGLLVKGPVAVLIPLAALLLSCLAARDAQPLWRALRDVRTWAWLLLLSAPWYAYALWRHGQAFIDGFILKHNVERFSAPMEGHSGGWLYFLVVAPLLWMPWSPLLLGWWGRLGALWRQAHTRHALIWAGFVLVFFSLSGTKLPHYGLYAAPGVVLLIAAAAVHARTALWVVVGALLLLWQALMVGVPLAFTRGPEHWVPEALRESVLGTPAAVPLEAIALLWGVLALAWGLWRWRARGGPARVTQRVAMTTLAAMALVHALVLTWVVWPWWAQTLQGPVRTLALGARSLEMPVQQLGGNWPSFAFYRQQPLSRRPEPVADTVFLLRASELAQRPAWTVLARERGMVLARPAPASALMPAPSSPEQTAAPAALRP